MRAPIAFDADSLSKLSPKKTGYLPHWRCFLASLAAATLVKFSEDMTVCVCVALQAKKTLARVLPVNDISKSA